ncbi:MAG: ZIP family metal transporter [Alicyclobacillaceae bacterium]|nr:ZIP family metal transporter [Alicyclobacillaceae bacterium]
MDPLLWVSLWSGMATPLGGLFILALGERAGRLLALFLGIAGGIMASVVGVDLLPSALRHGGTGAFWFGGTAGVAFMAVLRRAVERALDGWTDDPGRRDLLQLGWFLCFGIALHDLPEGLAIAAGDRVQPSLGAILALAVALHNIPEGMSMALPLRLAGVGPGTVLALTTAAGLMTPFGTWMGLSLFAVSPAGVAYALAFAGGAMAYVVARDIVPEALEADWRETCAGLVIGALLIHFAARLHT